MGAGRYSWLFLAAVIGGCAHTAGPKAAAPSPQSKWDAKSNLALEEILPAPKLGLPATQPVVRPPMEALELYARVRDAELRSQPLQAINLLQQAIALDPDGYALRYDLGWAYVTANSTDESAIAAFEKAAELEPDHLDLQTELGRLYLAKSDFVAAIQHLRLATLTSGYPNDDGRAAVVDFFLARALKESGYDRAALIQYTSLLKRFEHPSLSVQQNPELAYLLEKPDSLFIEIGELMEKHGEYADAIKAFKPAIDHSPDDFELQSRYTRDLALAGQRDAALQKAVDLVVRARATPQALSVLRDVCRVLNLRDEEVGELKKLSASRPGDQAVMYALADTLIAKNRTDEARTLLRTAWERSMGDIPLTRRLFSLCRDDVNTAAPLLIKALAANPEAVHNYSPLWAEILRAGQAVHLTISDLRKMPLDDRFESAREYWIAETAADSGRKIESRSALEASIRGTPPFAPAYRSLLAMDWLRPDLSDAQKIQAADDLAKRTVDPILQEELRGASLVYQKKDASAAEAFSQAIKLGGHSGDLLLAWANAQKGIGRDSQYEQRLWKLISDHPFFEDGYTTLFAYYANPDTGSIEQAMKVLSIWLVSDPQSTSARVSQAQVDIQSGQMHEAEAELSRLYIDDPNSPDVFHLLRQFYSTTGRTNELIAKLEDSRLAHPRDTDIVARLVSLYSDQKRNAEAIRLLDSARISIANDAYLLYSLAGLYIQLDQKLTAEDVLQQAIAIDPKNPGACNDLGFDWADQGKNLPQAEQLIRIAVAAEPDNESFLDSLGWVLYKRGKFDEAQKYLQQAISPSAFPDPVVLDHLGDTEYRMAKLDDARATWQRSLKDMGDGQIDRADMRQLRLQLLQKIRQAEAKKPVDLSS